MDSVGWYRSFVSHYAQHLGLTDHDFLTCPVACTCGGAWRGHRTPNA